MTMLACDEKRCASIVHCSTANCSLSAPASNSRLPCPRKAPAQCVGPSVWGPARKKGAEPGNGALSFYLMSRKWEAVVCVIIIMPLGNLSLQRFVNVWMSSNPCLRGPLRWFQLCKVCAWATFDISLQLYSEFTLVRYHVNIL
jgi:hypothetical protein